MSLASPPTNQLMRRLFCGHICVVQWNEYCCVGGPHHFAINSNVCFTVEDWIVFDTVTTLVHSSLMAIWPFSNVTAWLFFTSTTGHPEITHTGYVPPSGEVKFDGYSLLWSNGKFCEPISIIVYFATYYRFSNMNPEL